ncbi:uncharacterized protein PITG_22691 [Phytophthora infestans T30-4]|uniref:Secreted RxLR effector peptide protein n=1 Tax=Phytophthora infestans (strain T30-4) TaxID=403677 RepID=D0MVH2_PHYIT|nr:uncharacterized protein PITG_22691 [Phytophthora infestans T30-4]EEY63635.1 conserved hypothetical protein [Phytophthora infestans T30-4]|eukprot:XP_002907071.1 conserved hypothetical protein [Phytophthora infestans T30-4]
MTQTGPASSLALLVFVVSTRGGLSDGPHSLKEPPDAAPSLVSSLASANRARFGALRGRGGIWVRWRHEFAGGGVVCEGYTQSIRCTQFGYGRYQQILANPKITHDLLGVGCSLSGKILTLLKKVFALLNTLSVVIPLLSRVLLLLK